MSTERQGTAAIGWIMFAGTMMLLIGIFDVIQGLVALFKHEVYQVGESGLVLTTNFNTWGWGLLIWGIILILAALSLWGARAFGRWFALIVVFINMIGQFAWFPAYPLWSLIVIGLSIGVIWALTAGWRELEA